MVAEPETVSEVVESVCSLAAVQPVGGATKPALVSRNHTPLELSRLRGITEYEPAEFTLTARAGTPIAELATALREHDQCLPFDPLLVNAGATLGGTVASGLSGSGRQRYGGVRDFVLGVVFVTGLGELARGGGRVVKNAAGFDLPKLFVGSQGTLAVLVEITLKVFPRAAATRTLRIELAPAERAWAAFAALAGRGLDLEALDLEPPSTLWVRVGGLGPALEGRLRSVAADAGGEHETLDGSEEDAAWQRVRELDWIRAGELAVRVPLNAPAALRLEQHLCRLDAPPRRRYCAGAAFAWIAWPEDSPLAVLDAILSSCGLSAQIVRSPACSSRLGAPRDVELYRRVKQALDPKARFPSLLSASPGDRTESG